MQWQCSVAFLLRVRPGLGLELGLETRGLGLNDFRTVDLDLDSDLKREDLDLDLPLWDLTTTLNLRLRHCWLREKTN
jgi:hypothetical protein